MNKNEAKSVYDLMPGFTKEEMDELNTIGVLPGLTIIFFEIILIFFLIWIVNGGAKQIKELVFNITQKKQKIDEKEFKFHLEEAEMIEHKIHLDLLDGDESEKSSSGYCSSHNSVIYEDGTINLFLQKKVLNPLIPVQSENNLLMRGKRSFDVTCEPMGSKLHALASQKQTEEFPHQEYSSYNAFQDD
jgi:hypothetical protein